ncbi:hypothetical protein QQF64_026369 [Cirrhinus molitorella]|uniref:Ig-like domain-containing protein n=1 Tax=Cirrhinus molitorella TaxID=172907 RepID=A0ABR3N9E7_9TELE
MKVYWILTLFLTGAYSGFVALNHPTSLPGSCGDKVVWRKIFPIKATIAECQIKKCIIKESFQERFTVIPEKNCSLFIKSAKRNDRGEYVCSCNGFERNVNLEVVVTINMTAVEMGNITLPCSGDTQRDVRDVTWLYNEQKVLHYTANGATKPGDGYEGRVSLTDDGFKDGDVSLTISGVRQTDAGIYRCFLNDETIEGDPHAYILHVIEKLNSTGGNQTEGNNNEKPTYIGLILLFSLIICFLLILLCRKKMASPTVDTTDSEPVQESGQKHSTRPFYSGDETYELSNLRMNVNNDHSNSSGSKPELTKKVDD